MRTIGEEIALERKLAEHYKANNLKNEEKEHEKLAEWLERLKAYESNEFTSGLQKLAYQQGYSKAESDYFENTQIDRESSYKIGYEVGYNKALDDFVNTVKATFPHDNIAICNTEVIAEQLKAGVENDKR